MQFTCERSESGELHLLLLGLRYEDYTTFRPSLSHPVFSVDDLKEIRLQLLREYYFSFNYQKRIKEKIRRHPRFKESFNEFMDYISSSIAKMEVMAT